MEKWMMIGNPKSASASTGDAWNKSVEKLTKAGLEVEVAATECAGHAIELAQKAAEKGFRKFIAAGGDGTVHEVLNGLTDPEKITFGVIPAGTGNDFAATLGLPQKPLESLDVILNGTPRYTDYFDFGGVRGMNIAGCGIDVDILRHYESKKRKSKIQYFLSLLHCLFRYRPYEVELIDENGVKHAKKAFIACACNGKRFGGGIRICSVADVYDGYLDCILVNDMPRRKMLGALIKLVRGKIHLHKKSEVFHVKRFTMNGKFPVQIDGEIYEDLVFDAKIVSGKLKIFAPAK